MSEQGTLITQDIDGETHILCDKVLGMEETDIVFLILSSKESKLMFGVASEEDFNKNKFTGHY